MLTDLRHLVEEMNTRLPAVGLSVSRTKEALSSASGPVKRVIEHLLRMSGKRVRPTLIALTASLYDADPEPVADVAAAAELIHLASLVHDDIIDESDTRRGLPTLCKAFENSTAVLAGDLLFASAFQLLTPYSALGVLDAMTDAIRVMCEGEIEQLSTSFDAALDEETYLDHIRKKTAHFMAACCKCGALLGGAPPDDVDTLMGYGLNLGYAFQITDDVLDVVSDPSVTGKPSGLDLSRGTVTLPLIRLVKQAQESSRIEVAMIGEWLFNHWGELNDGSRRCEPESQSKYSGQSRQLNGLGDISSLRRMLIDCGMVSDTLQEAMRYAQAAKHCIEGIAQRREMVSLMCKLADAVVERDS